MPNSPPRAQKTTLPDVPVAEASRDVSLLPARQRWPAQRFTEEDSSASYPFLYETERDSVMRQGQILLWEPVTATSSGYVADGGKSEGSGNGGASQSDGGSPVAGFESDPAREERRALEALISNLPGMVYRCRIPDLQMEYISEGVEEITGYPRARFQPVGDLTYLSLLEPDDLQAADVLIQEALAKRGQYTVTYRIRDAQGRTRTLWDRGSGVADPNDPSKLIAIEGFTTDITNREVALSESRESRRRLDTLIANLPGIVYRLRLDTGTFEFVSDGASAATGIAAERFEREGLTLLFQQMHEEDRPRILEGLRHIKHDIGASPTYSRTYRLRDEQGKVRTLFDRGRVVSWDVETSRAQTVEGFVTDLSEQQESLTALENAQKYQQTLISNLPGMVYRCNLVDRTIEYMSEGAETISGYPSGHFVGNRMPTWSSLVLPEDRARIEAASDSALAAGSAFTMTYRIRNANNEIRHLWDHGRAVSYKRGNGVVEFLEGFVMDITKRETALAALRESEEKYRLLANSIDDVVTLVALDGTLLYVSPSVARLTGRLAEEVVGGHCSTNLHPDDAARVWATLSALVSTDETQSIEYRIRRADGTTIWVETRARMLRDADGQPYQLLNSTRDITQRRQAEEKLRWGAYHDALTRLPNRTLLQENISRLLIERDAASDGGTTDAPAALVFLDLDRFKHVNDTLGHIAGDRLLQEIARRIAGILGVGDLAARMGGDEFIVLLAHADDLPTVTATVRQILDTIARPMRLEGQDVSVSACAGITFYPHDGRDAAALFKTGDLALYRAKAKGRSVLELFTPDMSAEIIEQVRIEADLRRALEREEFVLYFQPQFDVRARRIVGVETLIRWQHPQRGLLSPAKFIPIAMESGLILPIEEWVLETVCCQAARWHREDGWPDLQIAINLSPQQCARAEFPALVADALTRHDLRPDRLLFELAESAIQQDTRSQNVLHELDKIGVRLAVDDFGAGFSSFAYLRKTPLDELKMDCIFVEQIEHNPTDHAILKAMIEMARALNFRVVAEGVETERQEAMLNALDCHILQGYRYGKPMPVHEIDALLRAQR